MLEKSRKSEIFSLFKEFQKEKGMAVNQGLNRRVDDKVLLVDGL